MISIDKMKGLTIKGKTLLKELRLERLVDEDYLEKLYNKHKEFFDEPKAHPLPSIKLMLIGNELLKDLEKLEHDVGDTIGRYYLESISRRANAMAICQGIGLYILYQLKELGLVAKRKAKC